MNDVDYRSELPGSHITGRILVHPGQARLSQNQRLILFPVRRLRKKEMKTPTPAMFSEFIELWRKSPAEIAAFAKRWGRLHMAKDGKVLLANEYHPSQRSPQNYYCEPVEGWRFFSRRAYTVLVIASDLRTKSSTSVEDWQSLSNIRDRIDLNLPWGLGLSKLHLMFLEDPKRIAAASPDFQRLLVSSEVNLWMTLSRVGLCLDLVQLPDDEVNWQLGVDYPSLLSAIAVQLALTVSSGRSLAACSGCGRLYIWFKRAPKAGVESFCSDCSNSGEPVRRADERRRKKIREARRLKTEGVSIPEITRQLSVRNPAIVERWILKGK